MARVLDVPDIFRKPESVIDWNRFVRAISDYLVHKYEPVYTFISGDATPSVIGGRLFKTAGTTAITDFDDGVLGQTIVILATDSITITDGAPIILNGGGNYAMTDTDTLTLTMFADQVWSEVARSVN